MPSAEQQFADQLGSLGGPSAAPSQAPVVQPPPQQNQNLFIPEDYANMQLPEDV